MKTPREILLERHRIQSAALDEIRANVIAGEVVTKVGQVSNLSPASVSERPRTTIGSSQKVGVPSSRPGGGLQPVTEHTGIQTDPHSRNTTPATNGELIEAGRLTSARRVNFETPLASMKDRLETCPTLLAAVLAWLNIRRMAWGAFGLAWCAIIGLNVAANSDLGSASAPAPKQDSQLLAGYRDYREQLALLLNEPTQEQKDISSPDTKVAPGPRSDTDRVRKDAFNCLTRELA